LTQQVHWLDLNKGILLLEMHGTKKKKKKKKKGGGGQTILINITLAKHGSKLPDDGLLTETCRSILM
jgi:hypothetical protein